MDIWTIYDHPRDFPHAIAARRFEADGVAKATSDVMLFPTLDLARAYFLCRGLFCLQREDHDDPVIVEMWI